MKKINNEIGLVFLPFIEMCSVGLIEGVVEPGSKAMSKMNNEIGMVFQQIMEMR